MPDATDEDERLPFDVELERLPAWVHVASALVIVVGVLVATHVVHMLVFLPFLVASSVGKRFASVATHVVVGPESLALGGRTIPRRDVVDAWADDVEPRATVAFGDDVELAILDFQNREQARRFSEALAPEADAESATRARVVGHKPRPLDMLASLRFVAIAAAFFSTGSWYGLFVLFFFALGTWNVLFAKQLVARRAELEVRTVLGARAFPYGDVASVDLDAGVIELSDGSEVRVPRSSLRDTTLASPAWLERARTRVLERVRPQA